MSDEEKRAQLDARNLARAQGHADGYDAGIAAAMGVLADMLAEREGQMSDCIKAGGHIDALYAKASELSRAQSAVGMLFGKSVKPTP